MTTVANRDQQELADAIAAAARLAFSSLFSDHPGQYYCCALVTSGEAHAPVVSAWSQEALSAAVANVRDPAEMRAALKWSHADSPYFSFGSDHFDTVKALFARRPRLTPDMSPEEWDAEYRLRLGAMEAAMAQLDIEGIFGRGPKRLETVLLVDVVPPDRTNTERARRLNPLDALREWLPEAGEE